MPTKQFYLIPMALIPIPDGGSAYEPKYLATKFQSGFSGWTGSNYGREYQFICCCNLADNDHASLAAHSDVFQFPANLDELVTENDLPELKRQIKNRNLPADWIVAWKSYRGIVRNIFNLCSVLQKVQCVKKRPLFKNNTLETPVADLTENERKALNIKNNGKLNLSDALTDCACWPHPHRLIVLGIDLQ